MLFYAFICDEESGGGGGGTVTGALNGLYLDGTEVKMGVNPLIENTDIDLNSFTWSTSGSGTINFDNVLTNTATATLIIGDDTLGFGAPAGAGLKHFFPSGKGSLIGALDPSLLGIPTDNVAGIVSLSTGLRDAVFLMGEDLFGGSSPQCFIGLTDDAGVQNSYNFTFSFLQLLDSATGGWAIPTTPGTTDQYLASTGPGSLCVWKDLPAAGSGTVTTAENGLYLSDPTTVRLGTNPLIENTDIALAGFTFSTSGTGTLDLAATLTNTGTVTHFSQNNVFGAGIQAGGIQYNSPTAGTVIMGGGDFTAAGGRDNTASLLSSSGASREAAIFVREDSTGGGDPTVLINLVDGAGTINQANFTHTLLQFVEPGGGWALPYAGGANTYVLSSTGVGNTATWVDPSVLAVNIYNADGNLSASRTLDGDGNNLTFTDIEQFALQGTGGSPNFIVTDATNNTLQLGNATNTITAIGQHATTGIGAGEVWINGSSSYVYCWTGGTIRFTDGSGGASRPELEFTQSTGTWLFDNGILNIDNAAFDITTSSWTSTVGTANLTSTGNFDITSTGGVWGATGNLAVSLTSDTSTVTLQSTLSNIVFNATNGTIDGNAVTIDMASTSGSTYQSAGTMDISSTGNLAALTGNTGVDITATTGDLDLVTSAATGDIWLTSGRDIRIESTAATDINSTGAVFIRSDSTVNIGDNTGTHGDINIYCSTSTSNVINMRTRDYQDGVATAGMPLVLRNASTGEVDFDTAAGLASGSFTAQSGETVTVVNGLITSIV